MKPQDENTVEMIYQFLDAELPEDTQDKLFNELAYNKALRKEFVFAYNSKNSLMLEYADASVPSGLDAKVFSMVQSSPSIFSSIKSMLSLKNIANSLVSTIVGSLISFAVFSSIYSNTLPNNQAGNKANSSTNIEKQESTPAVSQLNQAPMSSIVNGSASKHVNNTKQNGDVQLVQNDLPIETNNNYTVNKSNVNFNQVDNSSDNNTIKDVSPIEAVKIDDSGFMFDINKIYIEANSINTLKLFPYRDLSNISGADFSNISITAKYKFTDNQYLGLEYGRETFPIFVENIANNFDKKSYISWLGAVYQYDFDEIFYNISPMCKLFLGGNESGPIIKGDIGIMWQADTRIRFSLTLSGTELIYKYKGNWFDTQKIALKYGAELRL